MKIKLIDEALVEVERFKKAAMALKKKYPEIKTGKKEYSFPLFGSPESGAVKRASLDLTRALARLRKS